MFYIGRYKDCKSNKSISILSDSTERIVEFKEKNSLIMESSIEEIDENKNIKFYINEYYKNVLLNMEILETLIKEGKVLLCYEKQNQLYQHVLADYIELKYGIKVSEIVLDLQGNITIKDRPKSIKKILLDVIIENNLEELEEHACFNCEYGISPELVDDIIEENAEYREMNYDDAVRKIGNCELNPIEYSIRHKFHCDDYYPNESLLEKCMILKRQTVDNKND